MNIQAPSLAVAWLMVLTSSGAHAQSSESETTMKVGLSRYDTHSSTNGISGTGVPPGADAETGDATTVIFTLERMVTPNIGVEFAIGLPPTIHGKATGSIAMLGDNILVAKAIAPVLLLNYHFGEPASRWRAYLGAGINYTRFIDVRSSLAKDVSLSSSTGLALQAGLHCAFSRSWGAFASIAKINVKTKVDAVGNTDLATTLDLKPWVYTLGAAYSF